MSHTVYGTGCVKKISGGENQIAPTMDQESQLKTKNLRRFYNEYAQNYTQTVTLKKQFDFLFIFLILSISLVFSFRFTMLWQWNDSNYECWFEKGEIRFWWVWNVYAKYAKINLRYELLTKTKWFSYAYIQRNCTRYVSVYARIAYRPYYVLKNILLLLLDGNNITKKYVASIEFEMSEDYVESVYNSCSRTTFMFGLAWAIDFACGSYDSDTCTAKRWYNFMGDPVENSYVPFPINYKYTNSTKAFRAETKKCNEAYPV